MKAVFIDRDGVINRYPGDGEYVTSWGEFRFLPKARAAIAKLHRGGFSVFVISNQAGVGKGFYTREALDFLTVNMLREVEKAGGRIAGVYYCTHRPDQDCSCRKPRAGLIEKARGDHGIRDTHSFFIGDTMRDMKAARAAGCRSILVLSGKEKLANKENWDSAPDFVRRNLYEAVKFVCESAGL